MGIMSVEYGRDFYWQEAYHSTQSNPHQPARPQRADDEVGTEPEGNLLSRSIGAGVGQG